MKLSEFIDEHVLTNPEWRDAYDESELRRESARMLARERREQGISQAQLAERCGTDQAVISRIEAWSCEPLARHALARLGRARDAAGPQVRGDVRACEDWEAGSEGGAGHGPGRPEGNSTERRQGVRERENHRQGRGDDR
jgi:hypothetical protein